MNVKKIFAYFLTVAIMLPVFASNVLATSGVPLDEEHFPDPTFRSILIISDHNNNGYLDETEINSITQFMKPECGINSVKGIEYLTNLKTVNLDKNNLSYIDISHNKKLTTLNCSYNNISSLIVSGNSSIRYLNCVGNNLTNLDVSDCISLENLYCQKNNIQNINVNNCISLYDFNCSNNRISQINIESDTNLQYLDVDNNNISSINVIYNTRLNSLGCRNTLIGTLDLTNNKELSYLDCRDTNISRIDISCNPYLNDAYHDYLTENDSYSFYVDTNFYEGYEVWGFDLDDDHSSDIAGVSCLKINKNITVVDGNDSVPIGEPEGDIFWNWTDGTEDDGTSYYVNPYEIIFVYNDFDYNLYHNECYVYHDEEFIKSYYFYDYVSITASDLGGISYNDTVPSGTYTVVFLSHQGKFAFEESCYVYDYNPHPSPTPRPTNTPTPRPTVTPVPTSTPTPKPMATPVPTSTPTPKPTATPVPTGIPTPELTVAPTVTSAPVPTAKPTVSPTSVPENNGVEGFAERLYTCALNRASEPAGKAYWIDSLKHGTTGADAAYGFFFSAEVINSNISNSEFILRLYKTFMDRNPDSAEVEYWNFLLTFGATRDEVFWGFVNSVEWANVCLSYGINSGGLASPTITVDPSDDVIAFATRLYTTCLGREADPAGLEYWSVELANRRISGSDAARAYFFSEEFIDADYGNREYVNRLYLTFMDRNASQGEIEYWVNALTHGSSRLDVFSGFAYSEEFGNICAEYGIIR